MATQGAANGNSTRKDTLSRRLRTLDIEDDNTFETFLILADCLSGKLEAFAKLIRIEKTQDCRQATHHLSLSYEMLANPNTPVPISMDVQDKIANVIENEALIRNILKKGRTANYVAFKAACRAYNNAWEEAQGDLAEAFPGTQKQNFEAVGFAMEEAFGVKYREKN